MRRPVLRSVLRSHLGCLARGALVSVAGATSLACGKTEAPPPPPSIASSASAATSASASARGCVLPKEIAAGGIFTVARGCAVDVAARYEIDRRATLRIEPGATLRFAPDASLAVVSGALLAEGTADAPITFTARAAPDAGDARTMPAKPGSWVGLEAVARSTSELRLAHVVIEGAGQKSRRGSSAVRIFEPPGGVDAGVLPVTLVDSVVRHNEGRGVTNDVRGNRFVKLEGNVFEDDGGAAMFVHAELVASIGVNRFDDPPWVTGALWTSATWPKLARVVVYKQLAVGAAPGKETTLTLAEGTTLAFEDADLQVGLGEGKSRLVATGARFTANAPTASAAPAAPPTAWRGMRVLQHGGVTLERCAFDATGEGDPPGALVFEAKSEAASRVTATTFARLRGDAIVVRGGACGGLATAGTREGGGALCVAR